MSVEWWGGLLRSPPAEYNSALRPPPKLRCGSMMLWFRLRCWDECGVVGRRAELASMPSTIRRSHPAEYNSALRWWWRDYQLMGCWLQAWR